MKPSAQIDVLRAYLREHQVPAAVRDAIEERIVRLSDTAGANRLGLVAVYQDLGVSGGMRDGMDRAQANGVPIQLRVLGGSWEAAFDELMTARGLR
jgi:hypothetical protein